jgi:predicted dehydrogenase
MTRIALVGCGRWGQNILRDLQALGCEVAVADPDVEARRRAAAAGVREVACDLDGLAASDGVVIATTSSTHAAVIRRALERGTPVFVEKPMVCDAPAARDLATRSGSRLFVMDKWRYHPGIEELRRIRETGELGRPLGMHLRIVGWGLPHRDVDVTWLLLPHCLSIFLEVFGQVPPVQQAFAERLGEQAVTLAGVLGGAPWATVEVSARNPRKSREFRLHCEDGVAWLDDGWADHISVVRGKDGVGADARDVQQRPLSTELPLMRELRAFVERLGGGPPPRSSAEEGALVVERIAELRNLAGLPRCP